MLKKRDSAAGFVDSAVENKLVQALKGVVTLDEKTVTLDEFNELMK